MRLSGKEAIYGTGRNLGQGDDAQLPVRTGSRSSNTGPQNNTGDATVATQQAMAPELPGAVASRGGYAAPNVSAGLRDLAAVMQDTASSKAAAKREQLRELRAAFRAIPKERIARDLVELLRVEQGTTGVRAFFLKAEPRRGFVLSDSTYSAIVLTTRGLIKAYKYPRMKVLEVPARDQQIDFVPFGLTPGVLRERLYEVAQEIVRNPAEWRRFTVEVQSSGGGPRLGEEF